MRGSVYLHTDFQFPNGDKGRKLLIQLNTPSQDEPYLFVQTTSQPKNRPATPGCIPHRSLFFVEANKPFFDKNTWIQLHPVYEFDQAYLLQNSFRGDLQEVGTIPKQKVNEIANCFKRIDDVTPYQLKLIQKSREK